MFGHHLHAVTVHSPTQYELASLRSLNTENQERLFGQARSIAESCTNHHPENVIPQIMLRLQAKQEQHVAMLSVQKGDTPLLCPHQPQLQLPLLAPKGIQTQMILFLSGQVSIQEVVTNVSSLKEAVTTVSNRKEAVTKVSSLKLSQWPL